MHKERLFKRIDESWGALQDAIAGLSDEQLLTPGVTGHWSVRDLMAHVTTWEEEALHALPIIVEGGRLPKYASQGGIDEFNAKNQEAKAELSLDRLRQEMAATHQRLLAYVQRAPGEPYAQEGRWLKRLRLDAYGHWRQHTEQILAWRKAQGI